MNELSSLGLILLFALFGGHLVKFLRIPEVTGYILVGVAVGPSILGWVSHENLNTLSVFSEVALALILFSLGSIFELERFNTIGRGVIRITLTESAMAALLVAGGMLAFGQPWQIALLLGTIAMETAAASTLMVIRECNAQGALSETLTGIIGLNNILCLVGFSLVAALLDLTSHPPETGLLQTLYESLYPLLWQLIGSVALGFLVGVLLASWSTKVIEHGELSILLIGCMLLCVGVALILELSTLIASMTVGATVSNLSSNSKRMFHALSRTDPPFYAIFFVIAGADLNLQLLGGIGVLGVVYVVGRTGGKFLGAHLGAQKAGLPEIVRRWLGFGLMSQAGLAIGLALIINRRYPEYGTSVTTIVLAAVVVYEMIGPISARFAITRSGESQPRIPEPMESMFQ